MIKGTAAFAKTTMVDRHTSVTECLVWYHPLMSGSKYSRRSTSGSVHSSGREASLRMRWNSAGQLGGGSTSGCRMKPAISGCCKSSVTKLRATNWRVGIEGISW